MTTTAPAQLDTDAAVASRRARIRVAAAALAASAATVSVLLATTPWGDRLDSSSDEVLSYDKLLDVRERPGRACSSTRSPSRSSG